MSPILIALIVIGWLCVALVTGPVVGAFMAVGSASDRQDFHPRKNDFTHGDAYTND